jgi:hypothetical protein
VRVSERGESAVADVLRAAAPERARGGGADAAAPRLGLRERSRGGLLGAGVGASVVSDEPLRRRGGRLLPPSSSSARDEDGSGPSDAARQMQRAPPVANAQSAYVCIPPPLSMDAVLHAADESVSVRESELNTVVARAAGQQAI